MVAFCDSDGVDQVTEADRTSDQLVQIFDQDFPASHLDLMINMPRTGREGEKFFFRAT